MFLVDAAQSAGLVPIDLKATAIDFLAFPGHKALYGPTGTGALYVGPRANPRPWREGGTGGDSASETMPQQLPFFLEGGTPNVLGIAGLTAGVNWVAERGVDASREHEVALLQRVVDWVGRRRRLALRRPLGTGHARRRALADRPRRADAAGDRRHPR